MSALANLYPGDRIVELLIVVSLAVYVLSLAGLLVARSLRHSPAACHCVLLSVLVCIAVSPLLTWALTRSGLSFVSIPLSLPQGGRARPAEASSLRQEQSPRIVFHRGDWNAREVSQSAPFSQRREPVPDVNHASKGELVVDAERFTMPPTVFRGTVSILLAVWVSGSIALLLRVLRSCIGLEAIRRSARPTVFESFPQLLEEIRNILKVKRLPRIGISSEVLTPIAFGVLRPCVIVPASAVDRIAPDALRDSLVHEVAHILRRDPLVVLVQAAVAAVFWPIPLVHLLNRHLARVREEICDNHVLAYRGRVAYGETLVHLAKLATGDRLPAASMGMLHWPGKLENRIKGLIDHKRNVTTQTAPWHTFAVFVAFTLLNALICGTTFASNQTGASGQAGDQHGTADNSIAARASEDAQPNQPAEAAGDENNRVVPNEVDAEKTHRLVFKPRHGMKDKTSWTALARSTLGDGKPYEKLIARVTLEGSFPVKRPGDQEALFTVKLMAGSDDSLNVKLTAHNGASYNRILHRGKPLAWKLKGETYRLLYPTSEVAADQPAETAFATILVTCRPGTSDESGASREKVDEADENIENKPIQEAPENSSDEPPDDGGSDLLRNIRHSAAPILEEMVEEHDYGLTNDQLLCRVAPPFPPIRMTYYRVGQPTQAEAIPEGPSAMTFRWNGEQLRNWGMTFGDYNLTGVLNALLGIKSQRIEGPSNLLKTKLPGDWIVRSGAPKEAVVAQLEAILRDELNLDVHLEFRNVDREVYVARGHYKFTPFPGQPGEEKQFLTDETTMTDAIQVFGNELVPKGGAGGGTGDFHEFLSWLGRWIDTPIVEEVTEPPLRQISWYLHERSPFTEQTRREDHDPETVLLNITAQTGLQFAKESREVEVLLVEPGR